MLTELQKRTIQSVVNVFETGTPAGSYANITVAPGDPGHLTYGRSQTTLASGNLAILVKSYCDSPGAAHAGDLRAYLPRLAARDSALDADARLHALLREAAADDAMRRAQDEFFDHAYWDPAIRAAQGLSIQMPLGTGVVYDSFIHGAWVRLRDATLARLGLPAVAGSPAALARSASATDERAWVREYIALRRDWLATHPNSLLRRAVYRMDTFRALADAGNWDLALPLEAHGVTIDEAAVLERVATPSGGHSG
jgi:chitosanase